MKELFSNFFTASKGEILASFLNLISLMILAKSIGAESFGIYVLFYSYHELINKIFNFQTWQAYIKFGTDYLSDDDKLKSLLVSCILIDLASMILAAAVAFAGVSYFISFFDLDLMYLDLLRLISISIIFYSAELYLGILRLFNQYVVLANIQIGIALFRLTIFILTLIYFPSLEGFVYATILSAFAGMLIKLVVTIKHLAENSKVMQATTSFKCFDRKELISFVIFNNLDITVRMVTRQIDVLVLGKIFAAELVGAYKLAVHIGSVLAKIAQPIFQVFYPELAKLFAQNDISQAKQMLTRISAYLLTFSLVCYSFYFMVGENAIVLFFGYNYVETYAIGLVYLVSIVVAVTVTPLSSVIMANGLVKQAFYNQVICTVVFLIIFSLTVHQLGAYSAGISHVVFNIVWAIMSLVTIKVYRVFAYDK